MEGPGQTLIGLYDLLASTVALKEGADKPSGAAIREKGAVALAETHRGSHFSQLYGKDKRLRSGSYGTVYTCRHKAQPNTTYAVKVMDRKKLKAKDAAAVYREVRILNELTQSHGADVPVYFIELIDFFIEPDFLYMVQVYAAGGDVFDRLASRRQYTEHDARSLAQNLLEGVRHLHRHEPCPIVHRDLKPENLLLLDNISDTRILLADFGFARHVRDGEKCLTRCGSPGSLLLVYCLVVSSCT
jgi:serine/threonine protein kinase